MTVLSIDVNAEVGSEQDEAYEASDDTGFAGTGHVGVMYTSTSAGSRYNGGSIFRGLPTTPIAITDAALRVYVYGTGNDDVKGEIDCEDVDDADDYAGTADVTSRARTGTAASITAADSVGTGNYTLLCNFKDQVQTVVDRAGFAGPVNVICSGLNAATKQLAWRTQINAADDPRLTITYQNVASKGAKDLLLVGCSGRPKK